jgi:imidazolonepropionase-like amidohydrolase
MVDAWSGLLPVGLISQGNRPASLQVIDSLPADIAGVDAGLSSRVAAARAAGIAGAYLPSGGAEMQRGLGSSAGFSANDLPVANGFSALDLAMGSARMGGVNQFPATKQVSGLFDTASGLRDKIDEYPEKLEKFDQDMEKYQEKLDEYKEKKEEAEKASAKEEEAKKGDKEKKLEPPKRPKRPQRPHSTVTEEWMLEVIYGERQVRIHADSAFDIRAALALKAEYDLDLVIIGGFDADLIADEVAAAKVPVVLAASGDHGSTHPERRLTIRYQALIDAEVTVALASGGSDGTAAAILSRAGDLVAAGLDPQVVWASLTSIPAEIAGLDATHGDLKVGVAADLIHFQGSGPFNASATFRVFRADSGFDR